MGFLKGSQMLQQNCEHNKLYIFWKYGDWSFLVFPDTVNILKRQQSSPLYTDIMSFFFSCFFLCRVAFAFSTPLALFNAFHDIKTTTTEKPAWYRQSKNCEIPLFPTADRRFHTKVKCPTGRASFWVKFPTVRNLTRVKCPRIVLGRMGGFGIDLYITFIIRVSGWPVFCSLWPSRCLLRL